MWKYGNHLLKDFIDTVDVINRFSALAVHLAFSKSLEITLKLNMHILCIDVLLAESLEIFYLCVSRLVKYQKSLSYI